MLIPEGITPDNNSSMRIGFLKGGKISEKFGYEVGYYHDFNFAAPRLEECGHERPSAFLSARVIKYC